jgi:transposase
MAYGEQLRKAALKYLSTGKKLEDVAPLYQISISSIKRWKKARCETGSVGLQKRNTRSYKIATDKLTAYIKCSAMSFFFKHFLDCLI